MAAEEEQQSVISMQDVIEEEESLEATARAVLGPCDETNCTYPKGYMQRQALYACGTCMEQTNKLAGVCLACSLACHDGHTLYELYTKRSFRCDCGNSLFGESSKCHLFSEKSPINDQNSYNHNFKGLYCTCNRPYPDPEKDDEDEMIQCSVCEDWFHSRHLGHSPPAEFDEMVCAECMKRYSFLRVYELSHAHQDIEPSQANEQGQPHQAHKEAQSHSAIKQGQSHSANEQEQPHQCNDHNSSEQGPPISTSKAEENPVDGKKMSSPSRQADGPRGGGCVLKERVSDAALSSTGVAFFVEDWRSKLCKCQYCMDLYAASKVTFLLDDSDTVAAYEATSDQSLTTSTASTLEGGLTAFSTELNHFQQVEALQNYQDLSKGLRDYLKRFADEGKVVKRTDIEEFFDEMKEKKRRKLEEEEGTFPPQNCHF